MTLLCTDEIINDVYSSVVWVLLQRWDPMCLGTVAGTQGQRLSYHQVQRAHRSPGDLVQIQILIQAVWALGLPKLLTQRPHSEKQGPRGYLYQNKDKYDCISGSPSLQIT